MMQFERPAVSLLCILCGALIFFLIAHWPSLTNPYVIDDDVRQQIFWMQQWNDPELFQNDILTGYARNYVPWGVQAIYYAGSAFMNPVQFTKVVTGILFVVTAGLLFVLGLQFRHPRAPVIIVCASFFFTGFVMKISGGLSQSFAFPLLLAYLIFLGRDNLLGCGIVILLQSVLNPYIFLLSVVTHAFYLSFNYAPALFESIWKRPSPTAVARANPLTNPDAELPGPRANDPSGGLSIFTRLLLVNLPVIAGVFLMFLKYVVLNHADLGGLVTRAAMQGNPEYTAAGRYELMPAPSFLFELVRPFELSLPLGGTYWFIGWLIMAIIIASIVYAFTRPDKKVDLAGFRVFGYLLPASVVIFILASLLYMKLFLPGRYLEFSLTLFYCTALGIAFTIIPEYIPLVRKAFFLLVFLCIVLGGVRHYTVGIYDYSADAPLYEFLETTPKTSLVAGPPELMDNCMTFGRRKAFVTHELSHTWTDKFWEIMKKRTFDFFDAYYAEHPEEIREFARSYGIDYLVVREADLSPESMKTGRVYFEPFGAYIRAKAGITSHFAALDEKAFPIVYRKDGIRVLKIGPGSPPAARGL